MKVPFELILNVSELTNIPQLDDNSCYMIITMTNNRISNNYKHYHRSKYTCNPVPIVNHRCVFGNEGRLRRAFHVHVDSRTQMLSNHYLCISFVLKGQKDKDERLGGVTVNMTEYVNETTPSDIRYLLDDSKTNSIAKFSVSIRHLSNDRGVKYVVPREPEPKTNESANDEGRTAVNASTAELARGVSVLSGSDRNRNASPKPNMNNIATIPEAHAEDEQGETVELDPRTTKEVCDSVFKDDDTLSNLLNETYRFTWEANGRSYQEFTPMECVRDIVQYNGNGWKKNDEGISLMGYIKEEIEETMKPKNHMNLVINDTDSDDTLTESDDSINEAEFGRIDSPGYADRSVPPQESEVRDALTSWHVSSN